MAGVDDKTIEEVFLSDIPPLVIGGATFVVAISINDFIKKIFALYAGSPKESLIYEFLYSVSLIIILVIFIFVIYKIRNYYIRFREREKHDIKYGISILNSIEGYHGEILFTKTISKDIEIKTAITNTIPNSIYKLYVNFKPHNNDNDYDYCLLPVGIPDYYLKSDKNGNIVERLLLSPKYNIEELITNGIIILKKQIHTPIDEFNIICGNIKKIDNNEIDNNESFVIYDYDKKDVKQMNCKEIESKFNIHPPTKGYSMGSAPSNIREYYLKNCSMDLPDHLKEYEKLRDTIKLRKPYAFSNIIRSKKNRKDGNIPVPIHFSDPYIY
jgi:hypothetical protein